MKALLIGCGQLGSGHLQALATLSQIKEIEIVDPNQASLQLGQQRVAELGLKKSHIEIRWLDSLQKATPKGDLCVISTGADIRPRVFHEVATRLGYSNFILEKIVAQSVNGYQKMIDLAQSNNLSVWVNCQRRAHLSYQQIKKNLDSSKPFLFHLTGGNYGLAGNGIHFIDLFSFFDKCREIVLKGASIEPQLQKSKRGPNFFDLNGVLLGSSEKGSQIAISFSPNHSGPPHLSVVSTHYRAIIDDSVQTFYESREEKGWQWEKASYKGDLLASRMTGEFVVDIFATGKCALPTLEESFAAHRFVLESLTPHFNLLLNKKLDACPVT